MKKILVSPNAAIDRIFDMSTDADPPAVADFDWVDAEDETTSFDTYVNGVVVPHDVYVVQQGVPPRMPPADTTLNDIPEVARARFPSTRNR